MVWVSTRPVIVTLYVDGAPARGEVVAGPGLSGAVRPAAVARPALGMVPPTAVTHGLSTGWPAVTPVGGVHWPAGLPGRL